MSMAQLDYKEASFDVVGAGTATLYGVVRNPISQPPLSLGDVTVEIPGVASDVTGTDGAYRLDDIPAGQHTVIARRNLFLDKETPASLAEGESRELDISLYPATRQFLLFRMDYNLLAGFRPTKVQGKMAIYSKDATKHGMGGMELEVYIKTLREMHMAAEAVHWHYDGHYGMEYGVGSLVFDYNIQEGAIQAKHQDVSQGPVYSYDIEITPGQLIKIVFTDAGGNVILDTSRICDAQYIQAVRVPIEYYWHPEEGTYHLKAYHMLEWLYDPAIGWRNAFDCLRQPTARDIWDPSGFLHLKHTRYGNYFYIEGEAVDLGMVGSAEFEVSNLTMTPQPATRLDPVTIAVTVTNTGTVASSYTVNLTGKWTASKEVTLNPGQSKEVEMARIITHPEWGNFEVCVDGLCSTLTTTYS